MRRAQSLIAAVIIGLAGCAQEQLNTDLSLATYPGAELRKQLGLTLPRSEAMVIVFGEAAHHTRSEWSVVAWREANGSWVVERAGRETSAMLRIDTKINAPVKTSMSVEQGKSLDTLLNDPSVFRERVHGSEPRVGGFITQMELVTPTRSRTIQWSGRLRGNLGKVADSVIGK